MLMTKEPHVASLDWYVQNLCGYARICRRAKACPATNWKTLGHATAFGTGVEGAEHVKEVWLV